MTATDADTDANGSIETHLIVTPARNEAKNLRRLGQCLIEQTWRPEAWIVVDNGSTDGTADVVQELARFHGWIHLVSIESETKPARGRSSVRAFNAGVIAVPRLPDLITGLDADVSFGPEYFDALRRESGEIRGSAWPPACATSLPAAVGSRFT